VFCTGAALTAGEPHELQEVLEETNVSLLVQFLWFSSPYKQNIFISVSNFAKKTKTRHLQTKLPFVYLFCKNHWILLK
jgi:hypothetical protein